MKLLVDGVFFQLASSGIARVWSSILPLLIADPRLDVMILDRGGIPEIPGLKRIPFPSYKDLYTADDSLLIQKICEHYAIDAFTSTYYTTPITTPMVLMVYDMIPELFDFDLTHRHWQEKMLAMAYARRFVAISRNTADDLVRLYPDTDGATAVAHLGYDRSVFGAAGPADVKRLRRRTAFDRDYFMLVGSRDQHKGYKNTQLFFRALASIETADFDILCMGGEDEIDRETREALPAGVRILRMTGSDAELAAAYAGAVALIYPSLYEGFGLPVLEAMASGCPVITTNRGSLAEVAGDACLLVDGTSVSEMAAALAAVRRPATRTALTKSGIARARCFDWANMADAVVENTAAVVRIGQSAKYRSFAETWRTLRQMQSDVDVDRWN